MQPPTTVPLCSAAFRATPPPRPASFPLHSEYSVSSLRLEEEMADNLVGEWASAQPRWIRYILLEIFKFSLWSHMIGYKTSLCSISNNFAKQRDINANIVKMLRSDWEMQCTPKCQQFCEKTKKYSFICFFRYQMDTVAGAIVVWYHSFIYLRPLNPVGRAGANYMIL